MLLLCVPIPRGHWIYDNVWTLGFGRVNPEDKADDPPRYIQQNRNTTKELATDEDSSVVYPSITFLIRQLLSIIAALPKPQMLHIVPWDSTSSVLQLDKSTR